VSLSLSQGVYSDVSWNAPPSLLQRHSAGNLYSAGSKLAAASLHAAAYGLPQPANGLVNPMNMVSNPLHLRGILGAMPQPTAGLANSGQQSGVLSSAPASASLGAGHNSMFGGASALGGGGAASFGGVPPLGGGGAVSFTYAHERERALSNLAGAGPNPMFGGASQLGSGGGASAEFSHDGSSHYAPAPAPTLADDALLDDDMAVLDFLLGAVPPPSDDPASVPQVPNWMGHS